jgi:hypothetical protein
MNSKIVEYNVYKADIEHNKIIAGEKTYYDLRIM